MRSLVRLLSAVVVNYRSAALAAGCVASLRREAAGAGVPLEVVVVDNSAEPEERSFLGALDGTRYLPLETNAGYAGGLNAGVATANGDFLLLANPDLVFSPGSLSPLLRALEMPNAGAAGPRFTWDEEGRWLLPPLWLPSPGGEVAKILARSVLGIRSPLLRAWHALALPQWEASVPTAVPGLVGALILVPRDVWARVGPFDERYPLFYEDTDWSVRLAREGLLAILVPASRVVHLHGQSTARSSAGSLASFLVSEQRYFDIHFSGAARALRRAAGALLPPAAGHDVPIARRPLRLEWSARGRALVEMTTVPEGAPAAGRFVEEGFFDLAGADWERVPAGPVYLRVTQRESGKVVVSTAFRKDEPLSPDPGVGRA
ncbi:MAG TPA: glycosyltransferase family 2 protein [Thermoanaerobaculia bacterium]|nr:glycosyltransferase family 2 protein [Thermoanaerobaculia bacterium]